MRKLITTILIATIALAAPGLADTRKGSVAPGAAKTLTVVTLSNTTTTLNLAWVKKDTDLDLGLSCSGVLIGSSTAVTDRHEILVLSLPPGQNCIAIVNSFSGPKTKFWLHFSFSGSATPDVGEGQPFADETVPVLAPAEAEAAAELWAIATLMK